MVKSFSPFFRRLNKNFQIFFDLLLIDIFSQGLRSKRLFDFFGALALLVAISPLLALIAVLIKLDSSGPVLFRQWRHGFNQRPFRILKFRTMTVAEDGDDVTQAVKDDPRVTRIGRHLRRAFPRSISRYTLGKSGGRCRPGRPFQLSLLTSLSISRNPRGGSSRSDARLQQRAGGT